MNKKEFTDLLIKRLKEKLGNEYEVLPHTVPKNNGVKLYLLRFVTLVIFNIVSAMIDSVCTFLFAGFFL